jgi:hypothetical protein
MKKARLPIALFVCLTTLVLFFHFSHKSETNVFAATASHIVISEIQLSGKTTGTGLDEFVELYNPTDEVVNLIGWKLKKISSTGSESNLVSSISGIINPHSFFLIANPNFSGGVPVDQYYSATTSGLAADNAAILYSKSGSNFIEVDKVGIGDAINFETSPVGTPSAGASVERKANENSTSDSMTTGADEFLGNGEDTDNNFNDFILRNNPDPQNSSSIEEPPFNPSPTPTTEPTETETPTPTETPMPTETPTPTETPILTPSETPTPTPTETPSPTLTPTSTPTETPTQTPTPTTSPSPTPTSTPNPTITPIPTISPVPTPTPTPTGIPAPTPKLIATAVFPNRTISCYLYYNPIRFFNTTIFYPVMHCTFK